MNVASAIRALLGAALIVATISIPVVAQADEPTPEGKDWHLDSYIVDGKRHQVPKSVDATLWLEAGQAIGSAGCNGLIGEYEIDGESLTFSRVGLDTEVGCSDAWMDVEAG